MTAPGGRRPSDTHTDPKTQPRDAQNPRRPRGDLSDFARFGQDFFKRTVVTGLETLREISDTLPKDATQLLSKSKDEFVRNFFSREVLEFVTRVAVDRMLARAKDYRLEVSFQLKRIEPPKKDVK